MKSQAKFAPKKETKTGLRRNRVTKVYEVWGEGFDYKTNETKRKCLKEEVFNVASCSNAFNDIEAEIYKRYNSDEIKNIDHAGKIISLC